MDWIRWEWEQEGWGENGGIQYEESHHEFKREFGHERSWKMSRNKNDLNTVLRYKVLKNTNK